jgi:hypothetical protein
MPKHERLINNIISINIAKLNRKQLMRILIILLGVLSASSFAQAETKDWSFDVYLDNKLIGFHSFKLSNNNLLSDAKFKVKFLFLTAYDYQHTSKEQWNNDCLSSLDATTKENKSISKVNAYLDNGNFLVNGNVDKNEKKRSIAGCVMTFAYWNPKILTQTKLLNPQNGEYLDVSFKPEDDKKIDFNGDLKNVKVFHLYGNSSESLPEKPKIDILIWYDNNNEWMGLRSITPEGYTISYKRK